MITKRKVCRACGSRRLTQVLDLGKTPLANDFISPEEVSRYSAFLPLRLCICEECSLAQLAETVDPKVLYSRYAYVTSTSRTMEEHLSGQRDLLLKLTKPEGRQLRVLEIASNTGLFLQKFQERGAEVLGVEPAENISAIAHKSGIPTRTEFFCLPVAERIRSEWGEADLILGRHVFAHIDDWGELLEALLQISHEGTLIAFEVPYLVDFFEGTQFDTIYHEHLSYVSARSLEARLATSPFQLHRIDHYAIHGGSILFHLRRRTAGSDIHRSVTEALKKEDRLQLARPEAWRPFVDHVQRIQKELPRLIRQLREQGKRIIGYGASAKGNTLLNTCGLTARDLDYIIDNTPFKQNKLCPGSWIPIRPPEALLEDQADYALILAWNFAPEIIRRETVYQQRGGRFILPIPEPRIVESTPR